MPKQKPGLSKQDYPTPPEFLQAVKQLLQISAFNIDLAASWENNTAYRFYDEAYDSLKKEGDWISTGWNWLNPPYANIKLWVEKACRESLVGAKVAVLIPASTGSNWWRDWVHEKATVYLLNGRITFVGHTAPYPKDCALLLYSRDDCFDLPWYVVWSWVKDAK